MKSEYEGCDAHTTHNVAIENIGIENMEKWKWHISTDYC